MLVIILKEYLVMSMQVRVATETLGYDNSKLGPHQIDETIKSLEDPTQQIFISAMHLSHLRNIDFKGMSSLEMTDFEISITAKRYNRGEGINLENIVNNSNGYGKAVIKYKSNILEALR